MGGAEDNEEAQHTVKINVNKDNGIVVMFSKCHLPVGAWRLLLSRVLDRRAAVKHGPPIGCRHCCCLGRVLAYHEHDAMIRVQDKAHIIIMSVLVEHLGLACQRGEARCTGS